MLGAGWARWTLGASAGQAGHVLAKGDRGVPRAPDQIQRRAARGTSHLQLPCDGSAGTMPVKDDTWPGDLMPPPAQTQVPWETSSRPPAADRSTHRPETSACSTERWSSTPA